MKKLAAVSVWALAFSLFVGLFAMSASAKPYPPKKPTCEVSDTTLNPGQQVTVSGKHWKPGSTVRFTLRPEGISLGSATVGTNGKFSATVTIPSTVTAGPHTIECSGIDRKGDPAVLGTNITILGIVSAAGGGGAAFTGTTFNVPLWTVIVAGLLVLGVALVMLGRRRRRRAIRTGA